MSETTSVPVDKQTRKRLKVYKAINDFGSYDESVNDLLDNVDFDLEEIEDEVK